MFEGRIAEADLLAEPVLPPVPEDLLADPMPSDEDDWDEQTRLWRMSPADRFEAEFGCRRCRSRSRSWGT